MENKKTVQGVRITRDDVNVVTKNELQSSQIKSLVLFPPASIFSFAVRVILHNNVCT